MPTPVIHGCDYTDLGPQHVYPRPAVPKVVITMPAYQAERTLERTVLAIPEGLADELILVDDASRDGTAELARTLGLQRPRPPREPRLRRQPEVLLPAGARRRTPTSWCCSTPTTSTSRRPCRC